ncbi:hypothetical protein H8957_008405 [Semnopithecus entellus]
MHDVCRPRPQAPARAAVRRGSCIDLHSAFQSPDRPGTPVALKFPSRGCAGIPRPGGGRWPLGRGLPTGRAGSAAIGRTRKGRGRGGEALPGGSELRARTPLLAPSPSSPRGPGEERGPLPWSTGPTAAAGSNRRLQQTQNQVDEVVDIMRVNVDKVLERDQKLSELDDRADALQAGASQFETSAAKLKRKYWWKNCKMWAIGITVLVIFIIIIIVWVVSS